MRLRNLFYIINGCALLILLSGSVLGNDPNTADLPKTDIADANEPAISDANEPPIPTALEIATKANLAMWYRGDTCKADVNMTIINKQGQSQTREFTLLRKNAKESFDQKIYIYCHRPADVKRMVYLVHKHADPETENDRWLYLPSLDLIKSIEVQEKHTSFLGSDYLYEDIAGRNIKHDTYELVDANDAYFVVKNTPKNSEDIKFSYYNTRINRKTFLPEKTTFFNTDNKLYRIIEITKTDTVDDLPTPVSMVIRNLEDESRTELEFSNIEYNIRIDDIFNEQHLRRPPRIALRQNTDSP